MSLELLGLEPTATKEEVTARYRELARAAHPDGGGSSEQFQQLKDWRDKALQEIQFGSTVAKARMQLNALREAARGAQCPRCEGTGYSMRRQVGFREFKTICRLCHGKGKIQ